MHRFDGPIEFINNTVQNNFAFAPSAIFSNDQKFDQMTVNPTFEDFVQGEERYEALYLTVNDTQL